MRWKAVLPASRTDTPGEADLELLGSLVIMLHSSSLLPWEKFGAALDRAGRLGLMNRIASVTDHRTAAAYFADTGQAQFGYSRGTPLADPAEFPGREAAELSPRTTPGPGYSREKALEAIHARYEHCAAVTRHTLPRLMASPPVRALLLLPLQLNLVAATVTQSWGLQVNQATPDFDAIEPLLKARYKYWDDDADHPGYFAALSSRGPGGAGHQAHDLAPGPPASATSPGPPPRPSAHPPVPARLAREPPGRRAGAQRCTPNSAAHVKLEKCRQRGPSVAVREIADGAHRPSQRCTPTVLTAPTPVRYASVDTAT